MDLTTVSGFDWDDGNLAKCQKHGLTISEIEAVFANPHHLTPDVGHSNVEDRYLTVGKGSGPRPILVVFTLREAGGESLIRPISARYMHSKEIIHYEKASATPN